MGYRSTNTTVYSARYHLIWCPRDRKGVLVGAIELRLRQIIVGVVDELGGEVVGLEVMPDHLHLPVEVPPQVPRSRLARVLRGRSSRRLRREFPRLAGMGCWWSPSWLVPTVGGAPRGVVRRYVENQKRAV